MERITEKRRDLDKALKNLHESIKLFAESQNNNQISAIQTTVNRDSVIKRFELSFDLLWKCCKDLLENEYGLLIISPKSIS